MQEMSENDLHLSGIFFVFGNDVNETQSHLFVFKKIPRYCNSFIEGERKEVIHWRDNLYERTVFSFSRKRIA